MTKRFLSLALFILVCFALPQQAVAQSSYTDGLDVTYTFSDAAPVDEGGTARFTLTLSEADFFGAGFQINYRSGSANIATDLSMGRPTSFARNSAGLSFNLDLPIHNDTSAEGRETFTVELFRTAGNILLSATGTINPSDQPVVSIAATATAAEGSAITFAVNLGEAVSVPVVVRWTAQATGGANPAMLSGALSDLGRGQAPTGTVTFQANTTTAQTISIATADDTRVEGSEIFTVILDEGETGILPAGVTIPTVTEAGIATITEDDTAEVSIASTATAEEGSAVVFAVNLSAAVAEAVTVRWTATATGTNAAMLSGASSDLGSGQVTTGTVRFSANTTAQSISIATLEDTRVEGSETFTVTLSEDTQGGNSLPANVTIPTATEAGIATITDVVPMVSIAPTATAAEGSAITFAVNLSAAVPEAVTVRWTATATGANPATLSGASSDLGSGQAATGTVMFSANTTTAQSISIATLDDDRVEGSETFTVTLSEDTQGGNSLPANVAIPTATEAGIATITEDDTAEVSIAETAMAEEGSAVVFAVNLSTAVPEAVTVRWTATATGTNAATLSGASSDLGSGQVTTGTVMFSANTTTAQSISIATLDDTRTEDSETFTVTLSEDTQGGNSLPTNVTIPEATEAGIATITDDDGAMVSIASTAMAAEGSAITFAVNLSVAAAEAVTVRWTATATGNNPATLSGASSDLGSGQVTTGTVMFAANSTTAQSISVATADDTRVEGSETFTVTLDEDSTSALPMGVIIPAATAAGIATITEDDSAVVSIASTATAEEGSAVVFAVNLSAAVAESVTVRWTATATGDNPATLSGATSDLGLTQVTTGSVTFSANTTTAQSISVATLDDTRVEGSETFTVTLSEDTQGGNSLPTGVTIPEATEAGIGTITDNETSALAESRLVGAATALRRHVKRFDSMTSTVIHNRLEGRKAGGLNLKDGTMALGSESNERRMGAWLNGAYARFNGDATGRQADIYGGVDYLSDNNNWLIGALIGYEPVDLDIGEAAYEANYTHFGLYGGMRVSKRLILDGAVSYGTASPDISSETASASYDADRFTVRGGLTGDLGLKYGLGGGSITIEPQLGILYSRESLDGFTDSAGGTAGSEDLELGRLSAGPRLTWNINGSQVVGSIRAQWDFSDLDDGVDEEVSGAADIGLRLALAPHVDLGLYGEIDGIGITDEFITYGGRVELNARF